MAEKEIITTTLIGNTSFRTDHLSGRVSVTDVKLGKAPRAKRLSPFRLRKRGPAKTPSPFYIDENGVKCLKEDPDDQA